jgi:preprotein translocase subunit YajC
MLISTAYAQAAPAAPNALGGLESFLPLILIFVIFYFLLIRPQQKKMKTHKEMLGTIRKGDRIVTGGGMLGTVAKVEDNEITIEVAENVRVKVIRATVADVLNRPESGSAAKSDEAKPAGAQGETKTGAAGFLGKLLSGKDKS